MAGFFRAHDKGLDVQTPRASKDALEGVENTADGRAHLAARVRAVPEKGAANAALEKLLASCLGLARSDVSVVGGGTSRLKTVRLAGEPTGLAKKLEELAGRGSR